MKGVFSFKYNCNCDNIIYEVKVLNHKHSKENEPERKKSQNTTPIKIEDNEKPKRTIKDSVFRNLFS